MTRKPIEPWQKMVAWLLVGVLILGFGLGFTIGVSINVNGNHVEAR